VGEVSPPTETTQLLIAWANGDRRALDRLMPQVEGELRRLARGLMSHERPGHLLQPTALLNEAFIRLVDLRQVQWQNRAHFLAMTARIMRRVLVDAARVQRSQKRGGAEPISFPDDSGLASIEPARDVVALHDALEALAAVDPRKSQVVEMRFFGGLSVEETAVVLNVSKETVMRDWKFARTWLLRELSGR
jgi:RNA polymerase sigma factor (TIGR02999 family)